MGKKPHGLLILFEGLPSTVIQSQVFSRIRWLEANGFATFDVAAFTHLPDLLATSTVRARELGSAIHGDVLVQPSSKPALPFSHAINRRRLARLLESRPRYDFLHARTDYAAAVVGPLANAKGIPMLWDCRGDAVGEFLERAESAGHNRALVTWRAGLCRREALVAAACCTAASFVSEPLRTMWLGPLAGKPAFVVPCVGDGAIFHFDESLRLSERARLDYGGEDIVFVYSGSLAHYQGFDLVIDWFAKQAARHPLARLLVVTPNGEQARARLDASGIGDLAKVVSARFEDVNAKLNAADCALLIRPESRTNKAAFPTKFAEYGLAGLPVVVTPTVPDCYRVASHAGNLIARDAFRLPDRSAARRNEIGNHYRAVLTHYAFASETQKIFQSIAKG